MTPTNHVPPNSWIICPNGHRIAKAVDGVTIGKPRNWRAALTDDQDRRFQGVGYGCNQCSDGTQWLRASGGRGLVYHEPIEAKSGLIGP